MVKNNEIFIWVTLILIVLNLFFINTNKKMKKDINEFKNAMTIPLDYQLAFLESSYESAYFPFDSTDSTDSTDSSDENILYVMYSGIDCNRCLQNINNQLRSDDQYKCTEIKYFFFGRKEHIIKHKKFYKIQFDIIHVDTNTKKLDDFFGTSTTPICVLVNKLDKILYVHMPYYQFPKRTVEFFQKIKALQIMD